MRLRAALLISTAAFVALGLWLGVRAGTLPARGDAGPAPDPSARGPAARKPDTATVAAPVKRVLLGEVVAADGGEPVAGARVQAVLEDGAVVTVRSDAEGGFSFDGLPSKIVALRFHAPDFRDVIVPRDLLPTVPEAFWSQPLVRLAGAATAPQTTRIEGVVVDARGAPVPAFHLSVMVHGDEAPQREERDVVDPAGAFSLTVGPGRAFLFVVADDYRPAKRLDLELEEGEVEKVRVVLAPSSALHGRVVDTDTGAVIGGAQVTLVGTRGMAPVFTDGQGNFVLRSLPEENTNLHVSAAGYVELHAGGVDGRRSRDQTITLGLKRATDDQHAEVVGIGVAVGRTRDGVRVRAVYPGAPALGVLAEGDVIIEVDGVSAAGRSLQDNMGAIRGPEGTSVDLTVRDKDGATRTVRLERARVTVSK